MKSGIEFLSVVLITFFICFVTLLGLNTLTVKAQDKSETIESLKREVSILQKQLSIYQSQDQQCRAQLIRNAAEAQIPIVKTEK